VPRMLGRKPRLLNPAVPHMSALIAGQKPPPPPPAADYLSKMPNALGVMLNDSLGCCTCSAIYHAIQLWTCSTNETMQTNPDADVLSVYEEFCGYVQGDPSTDSGGIEQHVLHAWLEQGVPINAVSASTVNKLTAWFEVDARIRQDVEQVIYECGVCYIGFNIPDNIMLPGGSDPPRLWTYDPKATVLGGHAVILGSYDEEGVGLISWGEKYKMTWEFFHKYTDEAYALVDVDWINKTGLSPLGMDINTIVQQMRMLRMQWAQIVRG
jgi:hypothetical protein